MNSKEIKAHNLPKDRKVIYHMETKPYVMLFVLFGIGVITFYFNNVLAAVICATVLYAILLLPSKVLLDFTENYLVMYNRPSKSDCIMIYYDEIVSWSYKKGNFEDELFIELIDGKVERIECFGRLKVRQLLTRYAPNKERRIR